ncbi:hypothetical protein NO2_1477, partial [Candidatus Termititenax persephonae]
MVRGQALGHSDNRAVAAGYSRRSGVVLSGIYPPPP